MKPKAQLDLSLDDDLDLSLDDVDDLLDMGGQGGDDLLDLCLDELPEAQRQYNLLPPKQNQKDFCAAVAKRPEDDMALEDPLADFRFWWEKYQRDGNTTALAEAYLQGHATLHSRKDPAGLGYKYAVSPEFPGAYMRTTILETDGDCWKLLVLLPRSDHPRVRTNVEGGAHVYFRVVWFDTLTDLPVDKGEPFKLVRCPAGI